MNDQLIVGADHYLDVARLLLRGGIAAFPTDTVYGVGALPLESAAIDRLFSAKERPLDKAIPYLLAEPEDLPSVGTRLTAAARRLAQSFWPGALTIVVLRRFQRSTLLPSVAVRVPDLELTRELIRAAGGVLAVTSANISGAPNCTTAAEVLAQLGGRIDALLDGGACPRGAESTVVDATAETVRVLREGAISRAALAQVVELQA